MAQLQAEAAAMECDSHGLTMLPFFSGGGSQGSSGVRSSHSPSPRWQPTYAYSETSQLDETKTHFCIQTY